MTNHKDEQLREFCDKFVEFLKAGNDEKDMTNNMQLLQNMMKSALSTPPIGEGPDHLYARAKECIETLAEHAHPTMCWTFVALAHIGDQILNQLYFQKDNVDTRGINRG